MGETAATNEATNLTTLSATTMPFLTGRTLSRQAQNASTNAFSPVSLGGPPLERGVVTWAQASWILRR